MKKYGYDRETGALFSWEFDFRFEGWNIEAPLNAFVSFDRIEDKMIGSAFLSGRSGTTMVVQSDGLDQQHCLFGRDRRLGYWKSQGVDQNALGRMSLSLPLCVCGDIVYCPDKMAELCSQFPNSRVYACPVSRELPAFGVLVRNINRSPYRMPLIWENKGVIDAEFMEFDPKLDDDAVGRMADAVNLGVPVSNEVMTSIGVSPFYDRIIHRELRNSTDVVVIVRIADVDSLFPNVPISSKNYAATSVPVRMDTTDQFRKQTGYDKSFVDVFVATDYVPGLGAFMRFYKTFSGNSFVFSSSRGSVECDDFVPVFRKDRVYRVSKDKYE